MAARAQTGAESAARRDTVSARGTGVTAAPTVADGGWSSISARILMLLHPQHEGRYHIALLQVDRSTATPWTPLQTHTPIYACPIDPMDLYRPTLSPSTPFLARFRGQPRSTPQPGPAGSLRLKHRRFFC